jgi:hypothetical protein
MKKKEIVALLSNIPDETDIDLIISDSDDNVTAESLFINKLQNYPVEMVFDLPAGYSIVYDKYSLDSIDECSGNRIEDEAYRIATKICVGKRMTKSELDLSKVVTPGVERFIKEEAEIIIESLKKFDRGTGTYNVYIVEMNEIIFFDMYLNLDDATKLFVDKANQYYNFDGVFKTEQDVNDYRFSDDYLDSNDIYNIVMEQNL